MQKFKNVLIASDFDGTFACDDGTICKRNIEKIKYFINNGGLFTVCTGRSFQGFSKYNPEYINAPVLLCNGAMAYDYQKKELVFNNGVGENALKLAMDIKNYDSTIGIELYPFNETYIINPTEINHNHLKWQNIKYKVTENTENVPTPISKMMIHSEHSVLEYIYNNIMSEYSDIDAISGYGDWMEIIKTGYNKGIGLLTLGEKLNISKKDIYAIGDGYNDIDMLKAANKAFVPCNGDEKIKKIAYKVVCSNNDGAIADVIDILDGEY